MVIFFGPSHRFRPDLLDTDELVQYLDKTLKCVLNSQGRLEHYFPLFSNRSERVAKWATAPPCVRRVCKERCNYVRSY